MDDRGALFSRFGSDTRFHGSSGVVSKNGAGGCPRCAMGPWHDVLPGLRRFEGSCDCSSMATEGSRSRLCPSKRHTGQNLMRQAFLYLEWSRLKPTPPPAPRRCNKHLYFRVVLERLLRLLALFRP